MGLQITDIKSAIRDLQYVAEVNRCYLTNQYEYHLTAQDIEFLGLPKPKEYQTYLICIKYENLSYSAVQEFDYHHTDHHESFNIQKHDYESEESPIRRAYVAMFNYIRKRLYDDGKNEALHKIYEIELERRCEKVLGYMPTID